MIETKTIQHENKEYTYKIGISNATEILQNNINKQYPEWLEVDAGEKMFKYVEYDFFTPREVANKIIKEAKIIDSVYKMVLTSKEAGVRYTVVLDPFGL